MRRLVATLSWMPAAVLAADPQITSFIDTPDPVPAGGIYEYAIRVDNNLGDAALNTVLRLTVPRAATFVSASPASANCAPVSPTVVECNLGTVAGGGSAPRDVTFRWRALGPGPDFINATALVLSSNDENAGNNTQTSGTSVVSGANLAIAKTGAPNPVVGGALLTYSLTASNAGPNASGDIVVTDNLPPSVGFVSASGAGWACAHAAGVVTCNRAGPHAVGAAIPPITLVGRVNAPGGTVTNSASVAPASGAAGVADPDSTDNTVTVDTVVLPGADVNIAQKSVTSALPAIAGSDVSFRIQPRNAGPATAANAVVSDPLPAGWAFVSASGPNWTCSNAANTVSCTRASLPTTATDDITVVARAPAAAAPGGTAVTNTATISAATSDPDATNNSGSASLTLLPDGADLRIAKSKSPNPVAQGSNMVSSITVTNNGPRTATGPLRVVELLSGESFISASGTGWTCDASAAPVIVCNHANAGGLAANASLPLLAITTRADTAGSVSNTACTGGSVPASVGAALARPPAEGDPNPGNDCSTTTSSSTTVQPDLAITKSTSTPLGGDTTVGTNEAAVTYTLVVSNVSLVPQAATGVRIFDTVPAFITGRSSFGAITATPSAGSTATFSCATADDLVQCNQTGGQLRQGEAVTVAITVNRPLREGSFSNRASVSNVAEGDPNPNNNEATSPVTIAAIADVQMTGKTVNPGTVRAGEETAYVLSYRNNGPSPALGVTVADTFAFPGGDTGVTVVAISSTAPGSSCSIAAGAVLTPAAPGFNCTIGTLANGQTESITLRVRPNFQPGNASRVFTNLARIDTTTVENPAGGDNGNNEQGATLNVSPAEIDLLVNTTDRVGAVNLDPVGYTLNDTFLGYQVAVTNNGPSYGTGVRITETMTPPAGKRVRFVCDVTAFGGSTCNPVPLCSVANVTSGIGAAIPAFTCQVPAGNAGSGPAVGELAVGATKNIFLRFEVLDQPAPTGDVFTSSATVSANEPDVRAINDTESEQTTTRQRVDLRATKTASVASPTLMQPFNWTVRVTNGGPGHSLQTDVTDTLPAEAEVTGAITWTRTQQPANGACTLSGRVVSCALGQLDAGGEAVITIPVRIVGFPAGGSLTNTATIDTDPNKTGGIDTPGGNNTGTSTLTVQRSSLAGTVFEDRDRAGSNGGVPQASAQEPRIAGVTINLSGTDAYGNTVARSASTDSSGNYVFDNLAPSGPAGYTITQTQPAGYDNSPTAPPAAGAGAPAPGGSYAGGGGNGNSSYVTAQLNAGVAGVNYNFPEVRRPSLSGFVYVDVNANGVRDAGTDTAIAGATVRLLNATTGVQVALTTTNAAGAYSFTNLDPFLSYMLEEPLPSTPVGLANGPVNAGLVNGLACAAGCTPLSDVPIAGSDRIIFIDLSSGADGTQFNFGEVQLSFVSGLVWVDSNRNGVLDAAETTRLPGVTMRLVQGADCATGAVRQTTTTAADGSYRFDNVRAFQNYLVCQTQPTGYGAGSANGVAGDVATVSNLAATGSSNNNFGETLGSITGSVYQDTGNGVASQFDNGRRDAGEPGIAGVTITLTGNDITGALVNRTAVTDANGNFVFEDLLASSLISYVLTEGPIPPAAGTFIDGRDTFGTAGGNSTAINDTIIGLTLTAGQQATGYLFGELPIATIAGTVYIDRDRSNTIDATPTDGRIAGVTVRLVQGADCATGAVRQTTTTDAGGNYSFASVAVGGDYLVCETQPAGYANGTENPGTSAAAAGANAIRITNLPGTGSAGNHFGERVGSLAGSVYADHSPATPANTDNGVRDAGETGIAGVTISLTGVDALGNAVSRSTTTDASGNYRFDDLLQSGAGGYTLVEGAIPPASGVFNDGRDSAGSAGGSSAVNDQVSGIVLGAGVQGTGYNFGELPIAPITGTVYIDRDRNGSLGAGDGANPGIGGVTIRLVLGSNCFGTQVASTTTDASGNYSFSGVSAGLTYTLCETQPTGYADGSTNPGASGSSATSGAITLSNLPAGGSAGNHFGERTGSVSGAVYVDTNNDGQRQAAEAAIAGVSVTLSGTDAAGHAVSRTTSTDASGNYSFTDLLAAGPGGYTVTEQVAQPVVAGTTTLNGRTTAGSAGGTATAVSGLPSAVGAIALAAGADSAGNNFGELLPVSIGGTVFLDLDNNGLQNGPGDTGLAGVALVVSGVDDTGATVTRNVSTGADGSYAVNDLRPGTYMVTQPAQPTGTSNGTTVAGSAGGTATPVATLPSSISGIVLATSGAASSGNNFAEIPNNSVIAGRVWLDANNNGLIDAAEAGIAGVTIELSGTDTAGRTVARTATTGADGSFSFDQLAPGSYSLREPSQPAGTVNGVTLPGSAGGTATLPGTAPSTLTGITLGVGASATANNFGEVPGAEISGRVYADNNDNGVADADEAGLGGVTLVLTGTDDLGNAVSLTTTTAADGSYSFGNLRPGTYSVSQPAQPAGTVGGQTSAGSLGGSATASTAAISGITNIVLPPGGKATANNFGELAHSPDLRVGKRMLGSSFTVGFTGSYEIGVRNVGEVASSGVVTVSDRLPAGLSLAATPTGPGWTCVGAAGATSFSCTGNAPIAAGASAAGVISATVNVGAGAATASPVSNLVLVEGGGEIPARGPSAAERDAFNNGNAAALPACAPAIDHNVCRAPTAVQRAAAISGTVWYDIGSTQKLLDSGDRRLADWQVEVVEPASGAIVGRATTGADGKYVVRDLLPGVPLAVRFRDPASGVVFGYPVNGETAPGSSGAACDPAGAAAAGGASSCAASGALPSLSVLLAPGQELQQQSMPVDPSGVVYDSGLRQPVPGSVVTLAPVGACAGWNPVTGLVGGGLGGYTISGGSVAMTVGADGFYQFLFAPAAPASCTFGLTVTPPAGYTFASTAIPPAPGPLVPSGGAGSTYLVQPQAGAPTAAVGTGTTYYLGFNGGSGGANIIHNHLPIDPALPTGIALSKTGDKAVAEVGDSIRYTITVAVTAGALPRQTTVVDRLPAGFTYIRGTAMVGDTPIADPQGGAGPTLAFHLGAMPASRQLVLRYRVRVGVGAQQGDGINRAKAHACGVPAGCVDAGFNPLGGAVATNEAAFRVRVSGGVFTTEACVVGKIFMDCNGNHVQDSEELGIPGVRLLMQDGTTLVSDSEGKYSVCGVPPRSAVLKVDPLTLPRGSRLTTSSSRNLGDAGSLWLDIKNGELHRADFIEGSCSNTVIEQVKARRAQGEVRAPEAEQRGRPALRFDSKSAGKSTQTSPQQGTDGANQLAPKPRPPRPAPPGRSQDETHVPTPNLPMNQPAPAGRDSGTAPDAGGSDAR